jgi:TonB dependent receptor/TonB-dependent Receptor Plug Domain
LKIHPSLRVHGTNALIASLFSCVSNLVMSQTPGQTPIPVTEPSGSQPAVEVKAQRIPNAAGKQIFTGEELRQIPGSSGDPMKAIQAFPGIAATDDASGAPAVRGARPSDNAYYVDFLPVGYLFHLGGFASVLHPDLVRRFDISTAAWSPEYADVVGGVFDIGLRNPRKDRIGGKLDFSLLGANAIIEGPLTENLSFFLAGRRSWFDLIAKTGQDKDEGITFTVPVYNDTQARLLWSPNADHKVRFDLSTANDRIAFNLAPNSKAGQQDPVLIGNSNQRQSYRTFAGTWEGDFGKNVTNTLALGQMVNDYAATVGSAGGYTASVTTNYLRERMQLQITPSYLMTLGGSINRRIVDVNINANTPRCTEFNPNCDLTTAPRLTSIQKTAQNLSDVYVNNRWEFVPNWTVTGGLRVSRDDYIKRNFTEPRLGLEWNLTKQTLLSIAYGKHNQPAPLEESLRAIGNPNLDHLRSQHNAIGITQTFDDGWSVRAEAYTKTFKGYAVNDPLLNYVNGASGTARGLEFLVKKDGKGSLSNLSGFFALSVSNSKRKIDSTGASFPFDFDQPVIASLVGQYKLSPSWQLGAKWSYHTGTPYTPIVGTSTFADGRISPVYGDINSQRVPNYHRLDLRADWKISTNLTGYVEIINAYARKNVAGYSYSADYKKRDAVYQLPILPSIGLQYRF